MSKTVSRDLANLRDQMKASASEWLNAGTHAPDELARLYALAAERVNLHVATLESIIYENWGTTRQGAALEGEGTIALLHDPKELDRRAADALARRFYDLFTDYLPEPEGSTVIFGPFDSTPEEYRVALVRVFLQLINDAREERETWAREYIAAEAERMRDALKKPSSVGLGRFAFPADLTSGENDIS